MYKPPPPRVNGCWCCMQSCMFYVVCNIVVCKVVCFMLYVILLYAKLYVLCCMQSCMKYCCMQFHVLFFHAMLRGFMYESLYVIVLYERLYVFVFYAKLYASKQTRILIQWHQPGRFRGQMSVVYIAKLMFFLLYIFCLVFNAFLYVLFYTKSC